MITRITDIAYITTKQDLSRWTRANADVPGIKWSVFPGAGGTMIIVKYAEDRCSLNMANVSPDGYMANVSPHGAVPVASPIESPEIVRLIA